MDDKELLKSKLQDREWRLYNLYKIIDKYGNPILFVPNEFQREVLIDNIWYLNIILKARQLGLSTGIAMFILDMCLFNSNTTAGIIDATLPDAKKKLEKIKFAYDNLPFWLKNQITLVKNNETELEFRNGSYISAGTSFRGSTLQVLHISEYAKISKKEPLKAKEIKTGALNAVAPGQFVFIESTAEDGEGDFYEMVERAEKLKLINNELSQLDYKFFFFPWWLDQTYTLKVPAYFEFSQESIKYFNSLIALGIKLTDDQKYWYVKKLEEQGSEMKKEYPATSKEAFESASEDKYYKELLLQSEANHRISQFDFDPASDVILFLDIGRKDDTAVGFFQFIGKEIHVINYLEINDVHVSVTINEIKLLADKNRYRINKIVLPHDARQTRAESEKNIYQYFVDAFGIKVVDVEKLLEIELGINEVKKIFSRLFFIRSLTEVLREHLSKYSKKWNESLGRYVGPKHDEHSHAADMIRYMAVYYQEDNQNKIIKQKVIKSSYNPMRD